MRLIALILSASISSLSAFAQPDLSVVHFRDGKFFFDVYYACYVKKDYVVNNGPLYHFQIINKTSGQTGLELIRQSDSSYYFMSYFPSGKEKLQGFLNIKLDLYYTPFIPDYVKDPDGSKGIGKDTLVSIFNSSTIEYGWEYDSAGSISAGFYAWRYKTGIWYSGYPIKSRINDGSYFVRTKARRFYGGLSYSDSVKNLNSVTWPDIKGTWVLNQGFSHDSVFLYQQISKSSGESSIEFTSNKQYYLRNNYSNKAMNEHNDWWTIGDRLFLKVGKRTHEYRIISFTGPELVIQLGSIRNDINNEFL